MPAMPQIRRECAEYIAIGPNVWRRSADGKLNLCIAKCISSADAEQLAIELAIRDYYRNQLPRN